jgi:hypothetical protein
MRAECWLSAAQKYRKEIEMSKKSALQVKYEEAIEKGLVSESAAERTQALRSAGDLLSPALGELTARAKAAEERLEFERNSLKKAQAALDAANTELATLRPQIERGLAAEAELSLLKASSDEWKAEQTKLLTADAQQMQFKAQRAERQANATMAEAQSRFGQAGLQLLLDEVKSIVEAHNIPAPDLASLPSGISPLLLTLWGHSPIRAQFMIAYAKSFTSATEAFKQELMRVLRAGLPTYPSVWGATPQPDPIPNLGERLAVLTAMAVKWNVLTEVQKRIEAEQVQRQANFLLDNNANLAAQVTEAARRGDTREEIAVEESSTSLTGYAGEHPPECVCGRPGCNPLPAHLRPYEIEEEL